MLSIDGLLSADSQAAEFDREKKFLKEFPSKQVRVLSPDLQQGPDGWPYLLVEVCERGGEPAGGPLKWIASRGVGMAINPGKLPDGAPEVVLTFGMAWNYGETGELLASAEGAQPPEGASGDRPFNLRHGQALAAGAPSERHLPGYVRSVLRQFFLDQGVFAPKVLMVAADQINFDLCFSVESLGSPPEREHGGILEALSWFLPPHYSLALLSEKSVAGWQPL